MEKTPEDKALRKLQQVQGAGNLYSYSQLTMFRDCSFRWYGSYALGFKDAANFHTAFGTLFHAVSSRAVEAQVAGTLPGDAAGVEPWIAAARDRYRAVQALVPADAEESLATMALAAAAAMPADAESVQTESVLLQPLPAARGQTPGPLDLTHLEADLLRESDKDAYFRVLNALEAAGANALQVRPDATIFVPGAVRLRDWKTNARNPRKHLDDLVGTYTPQVQLYAAVGRRRWQERQVQGDLHFLEYGTPASVGVSKEDLDATARGAVELMGAIAHAAGRGPAGFAKAVGDACHYCHLVKMKRDGQPVCPEGAEYRKAKGWDRYDEQDALARIRAGIEWPGDDDYRAKLVMQGQQIERMEAVAAGTAEAADPVEAEVSTWTPETAAAYAREIQFLERGAQAAKDLRPYVARYVATKGAIVLDADESRGLPAGAWAISGVKPKTGWTEDVAAVEAVAVAAGLNPADYLRREVDVKAIANLDARSMDTVAAALEVALQAAGLDPSGFIRRTPNTAALDVALKTEALFDLLKTLRVEKTSPSVLRFQPAKDTGAATAAALPAAAPETDLSATEHHTETAAQAMAS